MNSLLEESKKYRKLADELLGSSKLIPVLEKFGEIKFVGSYVARLQMSGDIDIHVLRDKSFTKDETLLIFNEIVKNTRFNSYYIGDWNSTNLHPEFPEGYYIGLKIWFADEKWKIDIWLVSKTEQKKFDREHSDITKANLTLEQREEILRLKTNVVNFRRSMQGHKIVLDHIISRGGRDLDLSSYQQYMNICRDHLTDIWHTLESQKESADALDETNESVVGLRMNEIMKTLTIISVTTFPLTLIATIFAIHAGSTPFVNHPYGFWIISFITLVGALAMLVVFKTKKWMD